MRDKIDINAGLIVILAVILVQACKDTSSGPEPEPNPPVELEIISVEPDSGVAGTEIIITGTGFKPVASQNNVTFNGIESTVDSALATKLYTTVPEGTTSGEIEVTVDGETVGGPEFKVIKESGTEPLPELEITSVEPDSGITGAEIIIMGTGFDSVASQNRVFFNGVESDVDSSSMTELYTIVPEGASTGFIEVAVNGETVGGPEFEVITEPDLVELEITSIEPESGIIGTEVSIRGTGFNPMASQNTVIFNGVDSNVESASATELLTTVPDGASTGVIEVVVDGETTEGPEFQIFTTGAVEVIVKTSGPDQDRDGYVVNIDLQRTLGSSANDTLLFEDVEQGSRQLGLEDLDNECLVPAANPQDISVVAQDTIQALIEVECEEVVLKNKIVYRHCDGTCDGIYIIDSDGTNPKQLTSHTGDMNPVISPDGTKVAFVNAKRNPDFSEPHIEIYIIDASGYPITRIPRSADSSHDDIPSWSPDGKKILFMQHNNSSSGIDIASVNADGTGRTKITDDRQVDLYPVYTPDGSEIIFYSLNRGGESQIFQMNADGTNIKQLSDHDFFAHNLALSHDGSMLAFGVQEDQQIYVMNTDGTGTRPVTSDTTAKGFPSWSPDDRELIFYNYDESDIFKINLDGTGLLNLTNTPGIDEPYLHWSPVE